MVGLRSMRLGRRAAVTLAATGGMTAAAAVELRHLRSLNRDPEYARLIAPLGGRPFRVASADGTSLYAEAFGAEAGPALVFAHGWTEELRFWGPVIRCLKPAGLRLIAYDLPFHGKSVPPTSTAWWTQEYQLTAEFAMAVPIALSQALRLDRPAFMGCSVGGQLALDLAYGVNETRSLWWRKLQDFIIAFFGWFVLMGRNGIHVGDWVEINGVSSLISSICWRRAFIGTLSPMMR